MHARTVVPPSDTIGFDCSDDEPIPFLLTAAAEVALAATPRARYDTLVRQLAAQWADTPRRRAAHAWGVDAAAVTP